MRERNFPREPDKNFEKNGGERGDGVLKCGFLAGEFRFEKFAHCFGLLKVKTHIGRFTSREVGFEEGMPNSSA
jgi:hypothetical protein